MFSTKEQLIKKTGKHGVGRFSFLEQLIKEYKVTKSQDSKEQVLANLANFAYDPVNYDYLWRLKVLDLFFTALDDNSNKIVTFAIGGICNICLEPLSKQYILRNNGVQKISSLLSRNKEAIILSSITTLMYLDTPKSRKEIVTPENVKLMIEFSKSTNRRIQNLAKIFLKDFCNITEENLSNTTASSNISTNTGVKRRKTAVTSTITSVNAIASTNKGADKQVRTNINTITSTSSVTSSSADVSTNS